MNKTALKVFFICTAVAAATAVILLFINAMGLLYVSYDSGSAAAGSREHTLSEISSVYGEGGAAADASGILPEGCWCILVDGSGDVIWSQDKPADIPAHYTLNDIAVLSRWFLCDYPVYTRADRYGLFILGQPKNAVGKYQLVLSTDWFGSLPSKITLVLVLNVLLALALAFVIGLNLYKNIRRVTGGIDALSREETVHITDGGMFRETYRQINRCSETLQRKNSALAERDRARRNWVNGISHDIRTPLAVIMGNAEAVGSAAEPSADTAQRAEKIVAQAEKISRLVDDLNLMSSLENDMQPQRRERVRVCPLIRGVITDIVNNNLPAGFEIVPDLRGENAAVSCDRRLIERALFNLISNSVRHNEGGCRIYVLEYTEGNSVYICISDNGRGAEQAVLDSISVIPDSAHGLGLPLAYRIVTAHGGHMEVRNQNGLKVTIELPLAAPESKKP